MCSIIVPSSAYAQVLNDPEHDLCPAESGTIVAFFNGVNTQPKEAQRVVEIIPLLYGSSMANGDPIRYEVFYNWSKGFEDFVETFDQRLKEQGPLLENKYELFWEALKGGGSLTTKIITAVPAFASALSAFVDYVGAKTIALLTSLVSDPPNIANYIEHRARVDNLVLEGKKIVMVAHSQGNLFANSAYDYILPKVTTGSLKMVHIAPASPTTRGPHILADKDLVINGLRLVGTVAGNSDVIPPYLSRPAGLNNRTDGLGHGLLEIYLNDKYTPGRSSTGEFITEPAKRIRTAVMNAFDALIAPPTQIGTTGFFTVTMTWNGTGDVDLHATEPDGKHIFFGHSVGTSGTLDVDNTAAYGPEHFYATCDSSKMQLGTYRFGINNFSGASGKLATVQIASWHNGVLGTKTLDVGPDRPSFNLNSFIPVFDVTVTKDADTGIINASVSSI